jgi:hypothetical protein
VKYLTKFKPTQAVTYATIEETYVFKKVTFYSVRIEDDAYSEIEKFIIRFQQDKKYQEELDNILALLKIIGNDKGAMPIFFRDESTANALPPERRGAIRQNMLHFIDADLRLFCLRVSNEIVILFNGGIKESQKTQDSADLFPKFRLAQRLSRAINQKFTEKELRIDGKTLKGDFELVL